jgi:MoxR-like ATPase
MLATVIVVPVRHVSVTPSLEAAAIRLTDNGEQEAAAVHSASGHGEQRSRKRPLVRNLYNGSGGG